MTATIAIIMALLWLVLTLANVTSSYLHMILIGAVGLYIWSMVSRHHKA